MRKSLICVDLSAHAERNYLRNRLWYPRNPLRLSTLEYYTSWYPRNPYDVLVPSNIIRFKTLNK